MKILDTGIRYFVGVLFIFSGLVKLNDPIGTEIKLEEYFEVFSVDFAEFFIVFVPWTLELGFILIILEIVLGIALLVNYRMRITTWILFALIIFFTFLTFYSAYFNKVTDCGCFGDAIPLTPWQSFSKDVILIFCTGYLFFRRREFNELLSRRAGNILIGSFTILSFFVGYYAVQHLPYIDFRAYSIGENIATNMQPEEAPIFEYQFEKDGEVIFSQNYLSEDDGYAYVDYRVLNPEKSTPKITDYNIWNDEVGDYTQQSFEGDKLLIIVVDAENAGGSNMEEVASLVDQLEGKVECLSITSSDYESFENFRHTHQLATPYYYADGVVLKAMIRSNPGLVLLQDGTVKGKWHHNDVPAPATVLEILGKS